MWTYEVFIKKGIKKGEKLEIKIIDPKIGEINCEDIEETNFEGEIKSEIKNIKISRNNEEIHLILELDDYIEGRILCKYVKEYLTESDIVTVILSYIFGIPLAILSLIFGIFLYIGSILFAVGVLLLPFAVLLLPFILIIYFI